MEEDVRKIIEHIAKEGRSDIQKNHIQHGTTTVFDHSVNVAITSLRLSEKIKRSRYQGKQERTDTRCLASRLFSLRLARKGQEPFMAWFQTSGDSPQKMPETTLN